MVIGQVEHLTVIESTNLYCCCF